MCHSRVLHYSPPPPPSMEMAAEAAAAATCAAAVVASSSQAWLPPCPTQSSCRWQCHCNANIGIETFFSTEATDSLSLYPPKSSGTYRDGGIFPYQMFAGKYFFCQKKCAKLCIASTSQLFYDCSDGFEVNGPNQI